MKRSRNVALVLLAGSLAGCDEKPPSDRIFDSVAACREEFDEDTCRRKVEEAERLHAQSVPHFEDQAQCEAEYGAASCKRTTEPPSGFAAAPPSGGWFIPAMMGFMMGRALSAPPIPLYYGPRNAAAPNPDERPVYSGSSYYGGASGGTGRSFSTTSSSASSGTAARSATLSSPSATAVSRGGFGATGRGYSGGGS